MIEVQRRDSCRVCGARALLEPLFSFGEQYVSDFVSFRKVSRGQRLPINLQYCARCTLVQSEVTPPPELLYRRNYWYKSGTTDTMSAALADVTKAAQRVVPLKPWDVVLDIGSNDGTLLRTYPSSVITVGVEPARNLAKEGKRGVTLLIEDFWSAKAYERAMEDFAGGDCHIEGPKIVTACGMFYDLDDPNQFIADVATVLHEGGVFVAQFMGLKQTILRNDIGNFAHEHLEFYSLKSLILLFERNGLELFDVEENDVNGGSYRVYAKLARENWAKPQIGGASKYPDGCTERVYNALREESELISARKMREWFAGLTRNRDECVSFIRRAKIEGKKVAVYGASTKGNAILQWYGLDSFDIAFAMDRDPDKVGLYTVGTGIEIVSEEEGRARMPDYCFVLPYAFRSEFIERERDQEWRKRGGKFLFPLPKFEVV